MAPNAPDVQGSSGRPRAVVLGAGLAGLRGALALLEAGFEVEILERLGEPGGMARSLEKDGYVFDHGPHGFFSRDEWIVDEFKELVEPDGGYRWLTKWSQIHYRGQYFNHPLRLADVAGKMSPLTLLHAMGSFMWSRSRLMLRRRTAANAEEYLIDQFGEVLYEIFFGPYTEKVWAVSPRELDADFTRDRVPSLHLWDVIVKLFWQPTKERLTPSGRIGTHDLHQFYYPRRGGRTLPLGYARRVTGKGGRFRYDAEIDGVDLQRRVVSGRTSGEAWEVAFDYLLNTIPIDVYVDLLAPPAPREIADLARALRYRAVLLVNLCIDRESVIGPLWIYYTNRFFNRISEFRQFSDELVPVGKTGICLEIGCDVGDEIWTAADADIVERCMAELETLGLVTEKELEGYALIREGNAYPLYEVGYAQRVSRLIEWIESAGGVRTAGRQGRFLYCNQDAAIKSGFEGGVALAEAAGRGISAGETGNGEPVAKRRQIVS